MIFVVEISDTINDILLLFAGGIIGALAQPIGHIIKTKYDNKQSIKDKTTSSAKKIYSITSTKITTLLDNASDLKRDLISKQNSEYTDVNLQSLINHSIYEFSDLVKEFKEFRVEIDVIKDERIKSLIDDLLECANDLNNVVSKSRTKFNVSDYELAVTNLEISFDSFKSIVFNKF